MILLEEKMKKIDPHEQQEKRLKQFVKVEMVINVGSVSLSVPLLSTDSAITMSPASLYVGNTSQHRLIELLLGLEAFPMNSLVPVITNRDVGFGIRLASECNNFLYAISTVYNMRRVAKPIHQRSLRMWKRLAYDY